MVFRRIRIWKNKVKQCAASLYAKNILTKSRWLELSGKFTMGLGIPPLKAMLLLWILCLCSLDCRSACLLSTTCYPWQTPEAVYMCVYIYIYIYIYTHMCVYVYIMCIVLTFSAPRRLRGPPGRRRACGLRAVVAQPPRDLRGSCCCCCRYYHD